MTIQEIYELIKQKRESAENHRERIYKKMHEDEIKEQHYDCIYQELIGEINAYTDVLCLIESSGVLDDK